MNPRIRLLLTLLLAVALLAGALAYAAHLQIRREGLNRRLIAAVVDGRPGQVRTLIGEGADPNARVEPRGVPKTYWDRIKMLLRGGGSRPSVRPTALILAADAGDSLVVEQLLQAGADPNLTEGGGGAPLMFACMSGRSRVVEVLIEAGADVNAKDKDGVPALQRAAVYGNTEAVEMLLAHGADVNARANDNGTAIIYASRDGHREIVQRLLKAGADPNAKDNDGYTALRWAKERNHSDILRDLKQAGAK